MRRVRLRRRHLEHRRARQVRAHYLAAVRHFSLPADDHLIQETHFTREGGPIAAKRLLSSAKRPEMIFAANDVLAAGALQAAHELGFRVPEDVAVFGCDDIEFRVSCVLAHDRQPAKIRNRTKCGRAPARPDSNSQHSLAPYLPRRARPIFRESHRSD